jgi:hypothetical protein
MLGIWYPPKNKIPDIQLNKTIEEYSPRKKKTNIVAPCSVKNPATNSDSRNIIHILCNMFFYIIYQI